MVYRLFCFLVLLWSVGFSARQAQGQGQGQPYAVVVMDAHTGRVLHQVNSKTSAHPASLAKMMTLYLVFEALKAKKIHLSDRVLVSKRAAAQEPCNLNISAGETLTVKQAILALVSKSANNISVALAEKLHKTEENYAKVMSKKAHVLGLKNTVFRNATGLFHPYQKTTAHDMALLGRSLLKDFPKEYKFFSTQNFSFRGKTYKNHNHLLGKVPGVDGIKTGFFRKARSNLVASVKRDGRRFIVVVMGAKTWQERDKHVTELIQTVYRRPEHLSLVTAKVQPKVMLADQSKTTPQLIQQNNESYPSIDALLTLAENDSRS